jgi:hypothetical protein
MSHDTRRQYLENMQLTLDDVAEIANVEPEDLERLHQASPVFEGALTEGEHPHLRPWAGAQLELSVELGQIVRAGRLTEEQALGAYHQVIGQVRDLFITLALDLGRLDGFTVTVTPKDGAPPVELQFMARAVGDFYQWVTGA